MARHPRAFAAAVLGMTVSVAGAALGVPALTGLGLAACVIFAGTVAAAVLAALRVSDRLLRDPRCWELDPVRLPGWGSRQAELSGLILDQCAGDRRVLLGLVWCVQADAEQAARAAFVAPDDPESLEHVERVARRGVEVDRAVRRFIASVVRDRSIDADVQGMIRALAEVET